jgi:4-hydroxyphenylpyruvate dioxygenase
MDGVRRRTDPPTADLPKLPERATLDGIAYIEFACDDADSKMLETMLGQMGFVYCGTHKSKKVLRFRNGAVNILLNSDPASRSYETVRAHGTVVSEIAFIAQDARAAHARAVGLGAQQIDMPHREGETDIPTVCGVAASLIRFVDRDMKLWEDDFDDIVPQPDPVGQITRIDHIAQTMPYDEMLSWSLFYTTIFAMQKSPMVDVIDPDGIVKSQVVATDDRAVQLTLNGSEAQRTRANKFRTSAFGATVQHIALETENSITLAKALGAAGFDILPQTENYYADLSARFDLPKPLINELQKFNILYDEDEAGSLLHFYGGTFGNGLFFEFVERRQGYRGFGAANAPFRLAAQRRQMNAEPTAKPDLRR